ncbi:MAG: VOC family protein [Saonia sp.]
MKLYRIILPVDDIEKASEFYTTILGVQGIRVSPGRHYFNLHGTILACYDPIADGDKIATKWSFHENQYIYIATPDLERTFTNINTSNAMSMDEEIRLMPWGERLFYANDPFGNPICFVDETTIFTGT